MDTKLVERAFGGLQDLVIYEGGRLLSVGKTLYFIQCNGHHILNLRTPEDQSEFRVLIDSLHEACRRLSVAMETQGHRRMANQATTDEAVRECLVHAHRFSDNLEDIAGMFLGLARKTKTLEARDFFIDVFRKLTDTAAGAV